VPHRRGKMDVETALSLAKIIESQKREMGDPNVDGPRENDPMRVLQDQFYRGFNVPPGTEEQKQAYRDAIDQRLYTQGLRERRRAEAMAPSTRVLIADALRHGGLAASVTPYDVGFGDAAYAAGELLHPEGTYEDAALAAAGGVLTGGLGSGAILSKAAKEARALQKAAELAEEARKKGIRVEDLKLPKASKAPVSPKEARKAAESRALDPFPGAFKKADPGAVKRVDDFEDITPTVIKENPTLLKRGPDSVVIDPRTGQAIPPRVSDMAREIDRQLSRPNRADMALIRAARRERERSIDPALLGSTAVGVGAFALMESIRASSDYGNAFSETTQMNTPDMYDSSDDLRDIGPMLQQAISRAIQLNEQTGSVPIDLKRQIGKLEALQNTKQSLDSADDRAIKSGFMDPMKTSGFGDRAEDRSQNLSNVGLLLDMMNLEKAGMDPMKTSGFGDRIEAQRQAVQSGQSLFEPSGFGDRIEAQRQAVQSGEPLFKPSMPIDEGPPMVGPADPTPEQMRQMDATREIVPSMEDFGE